MSNVKENDIVDAVYIHIPFCNYICAYCNFCKVFYNKKLVTLYLKALKKEIISKYKNELITTLYIGGGTPSSLSLNELKQLFEILKIFNLAKDCEITIECNPDSLSKEKIKLFKNFGINRISLGVETINYKLQNILNRKTSKTKVISCIKDLKNNGFNNINVDLIYAIKGETISTLQTDLDFILSLDVPHISTYSLIIEPNTILKLQGVKNINTKLDREMYDIISTTLKNKSYIHYEISNFARNNYQSKHNLKYWYNKEYYGFGVGASSYLNNIRYTNTKSITNYINNKTIIEKEILSVKDKIFYEIMLNFRTNKGVDKEIFKDKYNVKIDELFDYKNLVKESILLEDNKYLRVDENYYYVLDKVVINFLDTLQTNVYNDIINKSEVIYE